MEEHPRPEDILKKLFAAAGFTPEPNEPLRHSLFCYQNKLPANHGDLHSCFCHYNYCPWHCPY
jgi:hypothetical protein